MKISRSIVLVVLAVLTVLAACGDQAPGTTDAAVDDAVVTVDADPDPFVGVFDDGGDFPRTGCVAGSLAGFDRLEHWPALALRSAYEPDLVTYRGWGEGDRAVPHTLTADDLLMRTVHQFDDRWTLEVIDICAVDADGTLRGHRAYCNEGAPCFPRPFVAPPLRRIAGEADGAHLALVGEFNGTPRWPGRTYNVRVAGDLAYLARGADGLRIVDIADPAQPRARGHFVAADDFWNDLKLVTAGARRYVVGASNVVRVVDVTDPDQPALVAELPTSAHTVFMDGTTAYLALGFPGPVRIFDLADPRAPRALGAIDGYDVHDLYVADGVAYLSDSFDGLRVVDVGDPTAPVELGLDAVPNHYWHSPWVTQVGGAPVILHGDENTTSELRLLDGRVGTPSFLAHLGTWSSPRPEVSIHNIMGLGARAFAAHYQDGLRVLDLTDPANPAQVAYFNTWTEHTGPAGMFVGCFGLDLDPARSRIYLADSIRGLLILDADATAWGR